MEDNPQNITIKRGEYFFNLSSQGLTYEVLIDSINQFFGRDDTRVIMYAFGGKTIRIQKNDDLKIALQHQDLTISVKDSNKEQSDEISEEIFEDQETFVAKVLELQQQNQINVKQNKSPEIITKTIPITKDIANEIIENKNKLRGHTDDFITSFLLSSANQIAEKSQNKYQGEKTKEKFFNIIYNLDEWKEKNCKINENELSSVPVISFDALQRPENIEQHQSLGLNDDQPWVYADFYAIENASKFLIDLENGQISEQKAREIYKNYKFSEKDWKSFVSRTVVARLNYMKNDINYPPSSFNKYSIKYGVPGMLEHFEDNEKIGILGDWGTGAPDANSLLDHLVKKEEVTIILHLGDVYHAGWPSEFKRISDKILALRKQYPKLRYYTVPGNHDYYTRGGPFFRHLSLLHTNLNHRQHHAFFCLRSKNQSVQFIGLNTGLNEHSLSKIANLGYEGTWIEQEQIDWAIDLIDTFKGKTILLTHHPMFSTFEAVIGCRSQHGKIHENFDPKLTAQLFRVLPKVTCWFWGHEHRFSTYKANSFGVNRSILLGNSAFQNDEQDYYKIKYPSGDITEDRCHPSRGFQRRYNHTAAILSNFKDKQPINAEYIYMESTFDLPTDEVKNRIKDSYSIPKHQLIQSEQTYFVLEAAGLSIGAKGDQARLSVNPIGLELQKIKETNRFLIRVSGTQTYLYLNKSGEVKLRELNEEKKANYEWILVANDPKNQDNLKTGDVFALKNHSSGKWVQKTFGLLSGIGLFDAFKTVYLKTSDTPSRFFFYRPPYENFHP